MNIASNFIYQPIDIKENDSSQKLYEFKEFIYSERVPEAFSAAKKSLFFDHMYILSIKNNQKMSTFPEKIEYLENKKFIYDPELLEQLTEFGYIYIDEHTKVSQDTKRLLQKNNTKEVWLYPIYSHLGNLTFLCCTRTNSNSTKHSLTEVNILEKISVMVGESIDHLYSQPYKQRLFA